VRSLPVANTHLLLQVRPSGALWKTEECIDILGPKFQKCNVIAQDFMALM
jgi:hypothetical protein